MPLSEPISPQIIHQTIKRITGKDEFFEVEQVGHYRAYKHASKSVIDVLNAARNNDDLEFIVYDGQRLTYNDFFNRVDKLASALQSELSVQKGDRVAIAMRNSPHWCIAYAAATLIGAIVVPINSWGKSEELAYSIDDCGATVFIADLARYNLVSDHLLSQKIPALVSDADESMNGMNSIDEFISRGNGNFSKPDIQSDDICVILYTSGSTGFPKGVAHNHTALCQSLMNMMYLGYLLMELEGARELRGGAEREAPMLTVPLFHATGLLGGFLMPAITGNKIVMMPKWDSEKALQLIQQEKVTILSTVPAILKDLLNHEKFESYDTSSLIRVASAGAATPAGLADTIEAKLGNISRSTGYGMTETMAVAATMSGAIFDLKPDSAGLISPIMDIRFSAASGEMLTLGEEGEIELRGSVVTSGYWEKPEANAQTFTDDGWLKTGDIGLLDVDGFLYITGRSKEIVIRGGENIFPGEIENAAYRNAAVQEVVVFGVPDEAMGEELAMVCFLNPTTQLSESGLREFLAGLLASYKVPKFIQFVSANLPRNASEKLHKLKVKELFVNGELG